MDKGLCPTQASFIFFFENIPCKFHIFYLDNLFISNHICCTPYVEFKAKVKIHGLTRAKYLGLPIFFIQQKETKKIKKARVIGTIKAGVIEEYSDCPRILC